MSKSPLSETGHLSGNKVTCMAPSLQVRQGCSFSLAGFQTGKFPTIHDIREQSFSHRARLLVEESQLPRLTTGRTRHRTGSVAGPGRRGPTGRQTGSRTGTWMAGRRTGRETSRRLKPTTAHQPLASNSWRHLVITTNSKLQIAN